jgi:hypothetical protein
MNQLQNMCKRKLPDFTLCHPGSPRKNGVRKEIRSSSKSRGAIQRVTHKLMRISADIVI